MNKGNQQLKEEIQGDLIKLKDNIVKEANKHAEKLTTNLAKKMEHLKKQLQQTMKAMEAICGPDTDKTGKQSND